MTQEEEFVRANWKEVTTFCGEIDLHAGPLPFWHHGWPSAAEFTRERLEKIAQLDDEIELVLNCDYTGLIETGERLTRRLQAIRAELTRGMKETLLL